MTSNTTRYTLDNLIPFTLYNISMVSLNSFGESLPSYYITVLTHPNPENAWRKKKLMEKARVGLPELPDTKGCCLSKNITSST